MKAMLKLMRGAGGLILILSTCLVGVAQEPAAESVRLDRLVGLAKLWAAVKYFHPYLAYRDNIDWDAALIRTIPKVDAARTTQEYSAAIEAMLKELGNPATHVLTSPPNAAALTPVPSAERQPTFRKNSDGILILTMTDYSEFEDFVGTTARLEALKKELSAASALVFDLRPSSAPSESAKGMAAYAISESGLPGAFTTAALDMPVERTRIHVGYPPQDGTTSGGYSSGFYLKGRPPLRPESGPRDIPVVFLIGPDADLPEMALGLQASGRGAVVAEGTSNEEIAIIIVPKVSIFPVRERVVAGKLNVGYGDFDVLKGGRDLRLTVTAVQRLSIGKLRQYQ